MIRSHPELQAIFQQMILEVESYSIMLLDIEGNILTWNKGVEKVHGYKSEEIIGQHINMFYLPDDRQSRVPDKLLQEARKNGSAKNIGRRIRRNGQIFWGSIEITSIKNEEGKVIGFTNLARELKDETDIGHFWFDADGIVHMKASAVPHTLEKIQDFRNVLASASGTEKICCVADIRDAIMVDTVSAFNRENISDVYIAVAFVSNDPVDNNTRLVFDSIKDKLPAQIFTSRNNAVVWIKQYL